MRHTEASSWEEKRLATADCVASFAIWPHRSLDRRGTLVLLGFVALAGTVMFLRSPARAVLPLALGPLLAVGALGLALWCNNRAARKGEMIEIGPDVVKVTRIGAAGPVGSMQFATGWVRIAVSNDRRVASRLTLTESGRACSVGECLSPEERKSLAVALTRSLAAARRAGAVH